MTTIKQELISIVSKMALLHYLCPLDELPDPSGPVIPSTTKIIIAEVNKEVRETKKKQKRGEYTKLTQTEKATIGTYAGKHSVSKAVKKFSDIEVKRK